MVLPVAFLGGCGQEFSGGPVGGGSSASGGAGGAGASGTSSSSSASTDTNSGTAGATSAGGTGGGTTVACGPGSVLQLTDDFDDDAINPSLWAAEQDPYTLPEEKEGQAYFTLNSGEAGRTAAFASYATWSLDHCSAFVHLTLPLPVGASGQAFFEAQLSGQLRAELAVRAGTAFGRLMDGNSEVSAGSVPLTASQPWLRIRHEGDMVHLEFSPDANAWTTVLSAALAGSVDSARFRFGATAFGTGQTGVVTFDNFNLPP